MILGYISLDETLDFNHVARRKTAGYGQDFLHNPFMRINSAYPLRNVMFFKKEKLLFDPVYNTYVTL